MRSYFGDVVAEGIDVGIAWTGNLTKPDQFFVHPHQLRSSDYEDDPGYPGWIFYSMNTKELGKSVILKLPVNYRYSLAGRRGEAVVTPLTQRSVAFEPETLSPEERIDIVKRIEAGFLRATEDGDWIEYKGADGKWYPVTERSQVFPDENRGVDGLDAWYTNSWESEKAGLVARGESFPGGAPFHVYWVHESCVPVAIRAIISKTVFRKPCVNSEKELEELKLVFQMFDKHSGCSSALERPVTRAEAAKFFDKKAIEYGMSKPFKVSEGGQIEYRVSPTTYSLAQLYTIWDGIQSEFDVGPELVYAQRCFVQLLASRYISIDWVGRASISYIEDSEYKLHPDEKDAVFVYVLWNLQEQCRRGIFHGTGKTIFGEDQLVSDCIRKKFYALVEAHEKQHRKKGRVTEWTQEQLRRLG